MTGAFVSLSKWRVCTSVWREWDKFLELPMREAYNIFSSGNEFWKGKTFTFQRQDAFVCTIWSFWTAGCQSVTSNKQEKVHLSLSPVKLVIRLTGIPLLEQLETLLDNVLWEFISFERDIVCLIADISHTSPKPNGAPSFKIWSCG